MDKIIKNLVGNNYEQLEDNILYINNNDCKNILSYFLYFYVKKKLTDEQLFVLLYVIIIIRKVDNININDLNVLLNSSTSKNQPIHKALIIFKNYLLLRKKVITVLNRFKNGNRPISNLFKYCHDPDTFYNVISFTYKSYIKSLDDNVTTIPSSLLNTKTTNNKNINQSPSSNNFTNKQNLLMNWKNITEDEIRNRLIFIFKHYGASLLIFLNVHMITVDEFNIYSYEDKILYYLKTVQTLKKSYESLDILLNHYKKAKIYLDELESFYKIILKKPTYNDITISNIVNIFVNE